MWWLAYDDAHGDGVVAGIQDGPDREFLRSYLRPGMTAFDIGAHHGYYTLLLAKKVGSQGRVVAFEPSPREFRRLRRHIRLNRCRNVIIEPIGVANQSGPKEFFVVDGTWSVRNSFRPPQSLMASSTQVRTISVDEYLAHHSDIVRIDLLKLDVEGGELAVLQGADHLLGLSWRPVILCELNDPVIVECRWQHRATDVIQLLVDRGYTWFAINERGRLCGPPTSKWICGDFVFIPAERMSEIAKFLASEG